MNEFQAFPISFSRHVPTVKLSAFLSRWNRLAIARTLPELRDVWRDALEYAEAIGSQGLNELWDFTCARWEELEAGAEECPEDEGTAPFRKVRKSRMEEGASVRSFSRAIDRGEREGPL